MDDRIVHLCYAGTSGSARVAINIAAGAERPPRHTYVLYGVCPPREDYTQRLDGLGCQWEYIHKTRFPPAYGKIAKAVLAMKPACAVFHGSRSFPVLWRLQIHRPPPVIAVQHGPSREITSWRRRQSCLIFSEQADRTVTVSEGIAELINRRSALADACRPLTVIPNGIDTDYWASAPPAASSGGPARLVMAATLDKHKDHATLLRAVAALRDRGRHVACDLLGDGPMRGKLQSLAAKLRIAELVTFAGDSDRDAVRDAFGRAQIVCHTARTESFGLAILEAMAAGRPVVAAGAVGVGELITHEQTGLLVKPGDVRAVADAVERLLGDTSLAARLGQAAQRAARDRYDQRTMAAAYEALADKIIPAVHGAS